MTAPGFDDGGTLPVGTATVRNTTGKPEQVLTAEQWAAMCQWPRTGHAQTCDWRAHVAAVNPAHRPRNPHCSHCGDTRGGPVGHETSECTWDSQP